MSPDPFTEDFLLRLVILKEEFSRNYCANYIKLYVACKCRVIFVKFFFNTLTLAKSIRLHVDIFQSPIRNFMSIHTFLVFMRTFCLKI